VRPIRLVTPIMVPERAGTIINISTARVTQPSALFPASTAFRASLAAFTKLFAEEHALKGTRINNVLPCCPRRGLITGNATASRAA
jgi:NAD(P)-dependent dehydrogenase (short-subunit alcohol dehydrogenase family)